MRLPMNNLRHFAKVSQSMCRPRSLHISSLHNSAFRHGSFVCRSKLSPYGTVPWTCQRRLLSADAATDLSVDAAEAFPLSSVADAVSDVAAVVAEPTLQSLGLATYWPSGLMQSALESLHVGLDVPWWTAIVIGSFCLRLLVFPLMIKARQNAAEMHNHMPTLTRLQERMAAARRVGDIEGTVKASKEMTAYMQRNQFNPFKNMLVPLAQAPIFVSVFIGLRSMTELPVVSLQTGGTLWFTDLTIPDPYFALPLLSMATMLATIEVGADGVQATQMNVQMRYFMRAMPIIMLPFIAKFPAAIFCYWLTNNVFSLIMVSVLRNNRVRKFFSIPDMVDHGANTYIRPSKQPKQGFMDSLKEAMENVRIAEEMEARRRENSLQMKESSKTSTTKQRTEASSLDTSTHDSKQRRDKL